MSIGMDILKPISNVKIVDRDKLSANDYNPNVVNSKNKKLLVESILHNGWTMPIVVRPDYTIIDGFHRWTVSGQEPLRSRLGNKVPVVVVDHDSKDGDVFGTITHNRARGVHQLEPMKKIVSELIDKGITPKEISKKLGMNEEEVFRLTDMTTEKFLELMTKGSEDKYSKTRVFLKT